MSRGGGLSTNCGGRLAWGRRASHSGSSSNLHGSFGVKDPLVFVLEFLPLLRQEGLELGLGGSLVGFSLLELEKLALPGGGGILALLGENGGLGGEGFVDPDLDGVESLGVTGGGGSSVQATLLDGGGQVGSDAGLRVLAGNEGVGHEIVPEQLVLEISIAEVGQGVVVR